MGCLSSFKFSSSSRWRCLPRQHQQRVQRPFPRKHRYQPNLLYQQKHPPLLPRKHQLQLLRKHPPLLRLLLQRKPRPPLLPQQPQPLLLQQKPQPPLLPRQPQPPLLPLKPQPPLLPSLVPVMFALRRGKVKGEAVKETSSKEHGAKPRLLRDSPSAGSVNASDPPKHAHRGQCRISTTTTTTTTLLLDEHVSFELPTNNLLF